MIAAVIALFLSVFVFEKSKHLFLLRLHFYWFLLAKVAAGIGVGLLYKYHYSGGDTFSFFQDAFIVISEPWSVMSEFVFAGKWISAESLVYIHKYKALFFVRLISLPLWLCQGSYWGLSVVLSLVSFWSIWLLANKLVIRFRLNQLAVLFSFMYFPEVLLWSSGVMKETLSFSFQCLSLYCLLSFLENKKRGLHFLFMAILSYLLFVLKFYVAATFVPALLAYAVASSVASWKKVVFCLTYLSLLLIATISHPLLAIDKIVGEIYLNMQETVKISDAGKYIPFQVFDGSVYTMLLESPNALLSALFRPFLWEGKNGLMAVISLVRFDFLIGVIVAMYWCRKVCLEGLAAVSYSLLSVTLLSLSSPNYGTLSRYMVASMPFLVLVVLQVSLPFITSILGEKGKSQQE